jgi:nucleoid DNA-binding protein
MATIMNAIQAYSPRILLGKIVSRKELVHYIAGRTGFNKGTIFNLLMEYQEAICFFNKAGRPVKLEGLGIFSPGIDKDGILRVNHRPDKELTIELNAKGAFEGDIKNKDMIGKSSDDFIVRWNEEHPNDKIKPRGAEDL